MSSCRKGQRPFGFLIFSIGASILDLASCNPFLLACKQLKSLELFVLHNTNGIDLLMEFWLSNRTESLEEVPIDTSNIEDKEDYTNVMNTTSEYVSRLEF
ncbi:hypothetical protein AVEN_267185-1 [Araneus ventricosus]|uniref:Uncharacterized protein n=1 Tax=Araneus ventricosus TaxID=182803 RepID=A0A4Y2SFN3_ARAVE|nr:hypothetical protein AVEN_267185-1 [Araneus ventricosus]